MARKPKATAPAQPNALSAALDAAVQAAAFAGRTCDYTYREFFKRFPIAPGYMWGRHTNVLCDELQAATEAVENGQCYYAYISMPPRHGKSDQVSRRFPAFYLSRNPDHEIILGTYAASLSEDLSHSARKCFEESGPNFGLKLSSDRNQIGAWMIEGHRGGMFAVGIGGAITGRGAHVLILDDYLKNREEAESETIRDGIWDAFRSDLMTRLAPAHAVIIVATRWHEDDLIGRIEREMVREPMFPRFKCINFPAWDEKTGWLFPERFPAKWYESRRATVGQYAWESLYQGNPQPRTGRMLRSDLVKIIKPDEVPAGLRRARAWDLASTEKERVKDDPDYTVGALTAWQNEKLYIIDLKRGQWSATMRDDIIVRTALEDGPAVNVWVETVAGYKDTFTRMRDLLRGKAIVKNSIPKGDKVTRAAVLEPTYEAGHVHIVEAPWNKDFLAEVGAFPKGKHDDAVDAVTISAAGAKGTQKVVSIHE